MAQTKKEPDKSAKLMNLDLLLHCIEGKLIMSRQPIQAKGQGGTDHKNEDRECKTKDDSCKKPTKECC